MAKSPADIAAKWLRNSQGAVRSYEDGVRATDRNPMEAALRQKDTMIARFMESMNNGRYEEGMQRFTFDQWKDRTIKKGGQNYSTGVQAGATAMQQFQEEFAPIRKRISDSVRAMPNATEAQRDARMMENVRQMRGTRFTRRRAR